MLNGTAGKRPFAENDPGAGPATVEPPENSASTSDQPLDEGDGAEIEIEAEFRRKLAGVRRLPRQARPGAIRDARNWRRAALNAMHERQRNARAAWYSLRKQRSRLAARFQRPDPR